MCLICTLVNILKNPFKINENVQSHIYPVHFALPLCNISYTLVSQEWYFLIHDKAIMFLELKVFISVANFFKNNYLECEMTIK